MKLRLTQAARADVNDLFAYIAGDSPRVAQRVVERILIAIEQLRDHQRIGHHGREPNTLELVVKRTSYVVVYRVELSIVVILRVRHGAQLRSPDT